MASGKVRINWLAIVVSVAAVVAVVAIGAIIVTQKPGVPTASPTPTTRPIVDDVQVEANAGAVSFGVGPNVVDTYVDFICPYCHQFEATEGETLQKLIAERTITLRIHPVSILDNRSAGTLYSSRAAGAFFAVAEADPAHAYAYFALLFNNQPPENSTGLTDAQLVQVAQIAGANLTADLQNAILTRKYQGYARTVALPAGAQGTPTVLVNGVAVPLTFDPQKDIIARLK